MDGPGEYLPDATEGITRIEDLPKDKVDSLARTPVDLGLAARNVLGF